MRGIGRQLTSSHYWNWSFSLLLFAVTVFAYEPAWHGKPIWDDDLHLTTPELRPASGLAHIWIQPKTTQQYHPLVDTLFWVEDKAWGNSTLGYHLVNILLHLISALLLLRILRQLEVPGAWLAAAIFALHPVHVESVAWLVELKNTLSGVFFFAAVLAYLKFDRSKSRKSYALVLILFALGLLAKTIVAALPAALLVVLWWKRGKLEWKRDVKPLIPFFVTGIAAGLVTAWMERKFSGAEGHGFDVSLVERFLIAGRAFWFCLGKLFWPTDLILIYPHWHVNSTVWWQYLFPVTALLLFAVLWALRTRWRSPLAALLFFTVMLFPLLGFFNLYYFNFSFVADHFQYLPSVAIITLVSAGAAMLMARLQRWHRIVSYGSSLLLLATLTGLTWQQSRMYLDSETCYRTVISKNPDCWTAQNNLGGILLQKGQVDEAIDHYKRALEIRPDYGRGRFNMSLALLQEGKVDEAITHLQRVLQMNPNHSRAYYSLANARLQQGQTDLAIAYYERALKLNPGYTEAHGSLGNALLQKGEIDAAIMHYQKAIELEPGSATAHYNLPVALHRQGHLDEAIVYYRKVLAIQPDYPDARYFLNQALFQNGQADETKKDSKK